MSLHEEFADDLALHALGTLDGAEREKLEKHLEECASCRRELELLRGDSSLLALTTAGPKPPARARQRLMSAIAEESKASSRPPAAEATSISGRRRFSWWVLPGLVTLAALALVCTNLWHQNSMLLGTVASLRARMADQEGKLEQANDVVATLLDPEATRIELVAVGNKPQPRGKAIYQRRNRNLIFLASNLPQLPAEKIYELWLFPANGGALRTTAKARRAAPAVNGSVAKL